VCRKWDEGLDHFIPEILNLEPNIATIRSVELPSDPAPTPFRMRAVMFVIGYTPFSPFGAI
jgi:hypothetical protein